MPRLNPPAFSGTELGYAEITSNFVTAGVANTIYPVTGLSITVTVGLRPVYITAYVPGIFVGTGTADVSTQIWEDGTFVQTSTSTSSATANKTVPGNAAVRRAPSPGAHTYDVRVKSNIAAVLTLSCGVGFPAFIYVVER